MRERPARRARGQRRGGGALRRRRRRSPRAGTTPGARERASRRATSHGRATVQAASHATRSSSPSTRQEPSPALHAMCETTWSCGTGSSPTARGRSPAAGPRDAYRRWRARVEHVDERRARRHARLHDGSAVRRGARLEVVGVEHDERVGRAPRRPPVRSNAKMPASLSVRDVSGVDQTTFVSAARGARRTPCGSRASFCDVRGTCRRPWGSRRPEDLAVGRVVAAGEVLLGAVVEVRDAVLREEQGERVAERGDVAVRRRRGSAARRGCR